jgi:hypothetical protein
MTWTYDDGGREAAGFSVTNDAGDCVARALAIAAEIPYQEAYDLLAETNKGWGGKRTARDGLRRLVYEYVFKSLGFEWTPTVRIGTGCVVHLRADELPPGRLIVRLSKHLSAVVDGVAHDNHDPTRDGTRCVYGYWQRP